MGNVIYNIATTIQTAKYRIPSDLRSEHRYGLVSTMVGDHMGIQGVVVFVFAWGMPFGGNEFWAIEVKGIERNFWEKRA